MEQKYKAILIDDEPFCTAGLEIDLKESCPEIEVIATCNSSKEGLKKIKELKPDVVFLDIEMPWMNGFELIELASPIDFQVIFVTAYDQFAVQAFRISAVDYLMKPVERNLLREAVDRLQSKTFNKDQQSQKLAQLLNNIKSPAQANPKISIPTSDGIDLIPVNQIIYCKADNNYTELNLISGKKKLVSRVLKEIEFQLEAFDFFRIHQSYLINMEHLSGFHRSEGGYVKMINGDELSVSRAKKQELSARIK